AAGGTPAAGRTWSLRPRPPRLPTGRPRATPCTRSAWASAPSWSPRTTSPEGCATWRWRCWPRARSSSRPGAISGRAAGAPGSARSGRTPGHSRRGGRHRDRWGRPFEPGFAVSGCVPDRGRAELLVGPELGCVVQLLERAVAGEGGMALGVGQDVPRCTGPPAELAHPDVAFGGQPRDRLRPAEPAVRPRADYLAG